MIMMNKELWEQTKREFRQKWKDYFKIHSGKLFCNHICVTIKNPYPLLVKADIQYPHGKNEEKIYVGYLSGDYDCPADEVVKCIKCGKIFADGVAVNGSFRTRKIISTNGR